MTLTQKQIRNIISALYTAIDWEDSLLDAYGNSLFGFKGQPEYLRGSSGIIGKTKATIRRYKKLITKMRTLQQKEGE